MSAGGSWWFPRGVLGRLSLLIAAFGATFAAEPKATEEYAPYLRQELGDGMLLEVPALLSMRYEDISTFPVDRQGTRLDNDALHQQLRVGARFDSKMALIPFLLFAEYEHDLLTGHIFGGPRIEGFGLPNEQETTQQLRKAWGRV